MIAKNITYKGLNFTTQNFSNTRVILQEFQFDWNTRTRILENQLFHWWQATRTLWDLRLFTISWVIVWATPELREIGLQEMKKAVIVWVWEEYWELTWEDYNQWKYKTRAKVFKPIQYRHRVSEPVIEFSFELLADTHEYFSYQKITQDVIINETALWNDELIWIDTDLWDEWDLMFSWGAILPMTLPTNLDNVNWIEIENKWNFIAPARIEIIWEIENPKIINHTNGRFYGLEIESQNLVIDNTGKNLVITNNWVNVQNARTSWSLTMLLNPWVNVLTLQWESDVTGVNIRIIYNYTYA